MTPYEQLESFFANREYYDNSRLKLIDACHRKGFYSSILQLDGVVGPGANFGTCFHAGLAAYSAGWGTIPEPSRRLMGVRAFATEYANFRFENAKGIVPTNHQLGRGIDILDAYFDHYLPEDSALKPIEAELGFAVEMSPRLGEPDFKPFTYVGAVDGLFERAFDNKIVPRETKTTRSDVSGRLRQLNFDHQPVGYVTSLREFPQLSSIDSFIGDVVLIAAKSMEFGRDYFTTNEIQRESWRTQIIGKVEHWRQLKSLAEGKTINQKLNIFWQNTADCFSYGKCAFYDLCEFGVSLQALDDFEKSVWNPLLKRPPSKIEISAEGQLDTITLSR